MNATTSSIQLSFSESASKFQQLVPSLFVFSLEYPFRVVTLKEHRFMMCHPEKIEHRAQICDAQVLLLTELERRTGMQVHGFPVPVGKYSFRPARRQTISSIGNADRIDVHLKLGREPEVEAVGHKNVFVTGAELVRKAQHTDDLG